MAGPRNLAIGVHRQDGHTNIAAETRHTIDTYHPRRLTLRVTEVITETATTRTFRLRRPDGADLPPFLAGQYVSVFADGTNRPYALSSSPARLGHWDLTIRRVPGGRISNHVIDTLTPGGTLTTTGPGESLGPVSGPGVPPYAPDRGRGRPSAAEPLRGRRVLPEGLVDTGDDHGDQAEGDDGLGPQEGEPVQHTADRGCAGGGVTERGEGEQGGGHPGEAGPDQALAE